MKPKYIIIHSMAKELLDAGVNYTAKDFLIKLGYSAHGFFYTEGSYDLWIPTNQIAKHAGVSKWLDDTDLNRCSIGYEICLDNCNDWSTLVREMKKPESFTNQMYKSLADQCAADCKKYGIDPMTQILTHEMVSGDHVRGAGKGKIDPGEGFDYMRLISMVKALMQ